MTEKIVVTGAGGFIGHHLVKRLVADGNYVVGIDLKYPEFEESDAQEFYIADLRDRVNTEQLFQFKIMDADTVYALAADMGGMGFISQNFFDIFRNNIEINMNTITYSRVIGVRKYLFTSSACVYPEHLQAGTDAKPLAEDMAFPAQPQDSYGWEKLISELLLEWATEDFQYEAKRIVRFHNVYGPLGTWDGGREKVPAALCRKVAMAKFYNHRTIEIWGDGEQTRSFMYIDDCIEGLLKIMENGDDRPINLGTDHMISINDFARIVTKVAGCSLDLKHVDGPQGVRGRNSDNTRISNALGWQPSITLEDGLKKTYEWIREQVYERERLEGEE